MKYCCLCENEIESFLPFGKMPGVFTSELKCVGSDPKNFYCPLCRCNDRARHLWLYINETGLYGKLQNADRVLYFAPEIGLLEKFSNKSRNIVLADFNPPAYKHLNKTILKIDIESINFENETFDLVIANHVLEHVRDYPKAMHEIRRVMKKGGFAILQTPYSRVIYNNFEDPAINTNELRERYYGQSDHVRIFGRRLFDDLAAVGFTVNRFKHQEILRNYDAAKYGVNILEDLVLCMNNVRLD